MTTIQGFVAAARFSGRTALLPGNMLYSRYMCCGSQKHSWIVTCAHLFFVQLLDKRPVLSIQRRRFARLCLRIRLLRQ